MTRRGTTDYEDRWESVYQRAYAGGKKHWRPEAVTPRAFVEFMRSSWRPAVGARVLEAGCSDGLNAIWLAQAGYAVTGVDISESAITRARETAAEADVHVELLHLDLVQEPLPYPWDYDLWVDIKTLHCLWRDEDRHRYLAAGTAALRVGGVLYLNCGMALADVREYFPSVFDSLDETTRAHADTPDRDLPRDRQAGIRCETLDWYCQELNDAGLIVFEARREAALETGWGVIIVARKLANRGRT